jgi:hypothetical protein
MFVQVIRGKTKDAAAMKAASDKWQAELRPGAVGFLGVTAGVADDGRTITIVRFESEAAAQKNGERPEQTAWWTDEMSKTYDGEPTFHSCPTVELFNAGGSNDAGFVQTMAYKTKDKDALLALTKDFERMGDSRPDLLGGLLAMADDGSVFDTNYFTSEAEARKAEKAEMPPEMQEAFKRFGELVDNVEYIDLRDPWLH